LAAAALDHYHHRKSAEGLAFARRITENDALLLILVFEGVRPLKARPIPGKRSL